MKGSGGTDDVYCLLWSASLTAISSPSTSEGVKVCISTDSNCITVAVWLKTELLPQVIVVFNPIVLKEKVVAATDIDSSVHEKFTGLGEKGSLSFESAGCADSSSLS